MSEVAAPAAPAAAPSPSPAAPAAPPAAAATTTQPVDTTKTETAAEKRARKYQIKVDGEVEDVDLDALDDAEIVRRLQMAKVAPKRMQETAEYRKKWAEISRLAESDPLGAARLLNQNFDPDKALEERLAQKYRESLMTPEQKAEAERVAKIEAREKELAAREEAIKNKSRAELEERVLKQTESDLITALEKGGLPKHPKTLYMLAQTAKLNLEKGIGLTPEQLAAEVRRELNENNRHITSSLKGEALLNHLGPDVVKEVVRLSVEKLKSTRASKFAPQQIQNVEPVEKPKRQIMSTKDFRKAVLGD